MHPIKPKSDPLIFGYTPWLVVLTILNNISQWEGLSHILWKIKAMFEITNQIKWGTPQIIQH